MHNRIAPRESRPEHQLEIGYLRDLTIAVKVEFYNIERNKYTRPLSLELLHEWDTTYRTPLTACEKWTFRDVRDMHTTKIHRAEVAFVDDLIERLRTGINEGTPTAHITIDDIEALGRAYRALDVCREQLVWY